MWLQNSLITIYKPRRLIVEANWGFYNSKQALFKLAVRPKRLESEKQHEATRFSRFQGRITNLITNLLIFYLCGH